MEDVLCSYYIYLLECDFFKKKKEIVDFKWLNFSIQPFI
jgi:hypothetical protein